VGSRLAKTVGQNMQQKAPNELRRRQGHGGGLACAGVVLPAKSHSPAFQRDHTLEALKTLIIRDSLKQLLVVIFENLH
jgi:hypothetical protein